MTIIDLRWIYNFISVNYSQIRSSDHIFRRNLVPSFSHSSVSILTPRQVFFTSLLCLVSFGGSWLLLESPRWLLSRGQVREALGVLNQASQANGKDPVGEMDFSPEPFKV